MWSRTYVILGRVCPCTTYFTESKDGFIFKRAGYRKSYAMQNRAGLHEIVLGSASVMQRRRFFYSVEKASIVLWKLIIKTRHTTGPCNTPLFIFSGDTRRKPA